MHRFILPAFIANVLLVPMGCAVAADSAANPSAGSPSASTGPSQVQASQGTNAAYHAMTEDAVADMTVVDLQGRPMTDPDRITALRQAARLYVGSRQSRHLQIPADASLVMFKYHGGSDRDMDLIVEEEPTTDGRPGGAYSKACAGDQYNGWSAVDFNSNPYFHAELTCKQWGSKEIALVLPKVAASIIDAGDIHPEIAPTFSREFGFMNEAGEQVPVPGKLLLKLNGDNPGHAGEIRGKTLCFDQMTAGTYILYGKLTDLRFERHFFEFVTFRQPGTTWITLKAPTFWMDADDAVKLGMAEELPVLLYVSANWSGACRRLEEEVFSDPVFAGWCKNRVAPCQIERSKLGGLMKKYGYTWDDADVTSYPTVLIWDPVNNAPLGRIGYQAGGAAAWMQAVDRILAASQKK